MSIIFIESVLKKSRASLDYTDYETITQIEVHRGRGKICVIFFEICVIRSHHALSLGIIVEPFSGFPSQVTGPDHLPQQGTGTIFGVAQFFVKIVLNHQEGVQTDQVR